MQSNCPQRKITKKTKTNLKHNSTQINMSLFVSWFMEILTSDFIYDNNSILIMPPISKYILALFAFCITSAVNKELPYNFPIATL